MNRFHATGLAALLLIGLAGGSRTQEPAAGGGQDAGPFRISVNVNLVVLHPTVSDRKGRFVSDLLERNFQVYEDGVRQSIGLFRHEDVPVTVGLVVDHSGSMLPKLWDVIAAARTFVRASNPEDRMFVVNFNERVTIGLPAGIGFTGRPDELEAAISNAPTTGQTALYDAVATGLDRLQAGPHEKKVLIVISDGGDNASGHSQAGVLKMAAQSSAMVYAIGIFDHDDPDQNPDVLRNLAQSTGGEAFFPDEPDKVVAICERIARDIRNQYTIGYIPNTAVRPGVFRAIRVVAGGTPDGKLSVRARSGYFAGEDHPVAREPAK